MSLGHRDRAYSRKERISPKQHGWASDHCLEEPASSACELLLQHTSDVQRAGPQEDSH